MTSISPSLHEIMMRHALVIARQEPLRPFGTVIVDPVGEIIAEGFNRSNENPTWHGEMDALNECARSHPKSDWSNYILYTTAEPCPMCMSAILWSGIGAVVYGTSIATLKKYGFAQIDLPASEVVSRSWDPEVSLMGGILEQECDQLFLNAIQSRDAE